MSVYKRLTDISPHSGAHPRKKKVNKEEKKIEKHVTFITNVFSLSSVLLLLSINFAKARHFPQPCHLRKIKEEMKNSS